MTRIFRKRTMIAKAILLGIYGISVLVLAGSVSSVGAQATDSSNEARAETVTLKIDGWTCRSCEKDIRRALLAVPGVQAADVSYPRGGAVVSVEPGRVTPDQLSKAVESAGTLLSTYHATVVPNGALSEASTSTGGVGEFLKGMLK
jgi:copper chaperone CopZ